MPGLIIDGKEVDVPGVKIRNFKDEPKLALRVGQPAANDGGVRTLPISLVILHTTKGIPDASDKRPQVIKPGFGPNTQAEDRTADFWSSDPTASGAHIVVDHDGSAACLADLKTVCAYHAGQYEVNQRSIGIEIYQGNSAEMYEGQLDNVRKIVDTLTVYFGIQRQIPDRYPNNTPIPRLKKGGRDIIGVFGHRDVSDQRGFGDPGDVIMNVLAKKDYEEFDFISCHDLEVWKLRQSTLQKNNPYITIDGIPGSQTTAILARNGYLHGLWALPPKTEAEQETGSGHDALTSMLDAFFPALVTAAGDVQKALSIISDWIKQHQS